MNKDKKNLINLFCKLVKIDSPSKQEQQLSDYIKKTVAKWGYTFQEDNCASKIKGECSNLYIKPKIKLDKDSILLSGHLDTVQSNKNIKLKITDKRIYSVSNTILGADDKSAVCAILYFLNKIKKNEKILKKVEVCFTVAEEIGLLGSKYIDKKLINSKRAIILDSDGKFGNITNRAPEHNIIEVYIKGKPAHSGVAPEKGINAIAVSSKIINSFKWGRIDKYTTANIGKISGGKAVNIVPDNAYFLCEIRSHSSKKINHLTEKLKKLINNICLSSNAKYKIKINNAYKSFHIKEDDEFIKRVKHIIKEMKIKPELKITNGGSDANHFNAKGIKALNLSCGMFNPHSVKEFLSIDDLYKTYSFLNYFFKQ